MEQSFYEALLDTVPPALIEYMSSEHINALVDLACYWSQEELSELLIENVADI